MSQMARHFCFFLSHGGWSPYGPEKIDVFDFSSPILSQDMRPSLANRPSSKHSGICHDIIVLCMNVTEFVAVKFVQHKIVANFIMAQL
jgi:hypothetical protein